MIGSLKPGETTSDTMGLLAGKVTNSTLHDLSINHAQWQPGDAHTFPGARIALGGLIGYAQRSDLHHLQLHHAKIQTHSGTPFIGGMIGRVDNETRLDHVTISYLTLDVRRHLKPVKKHVIGGAIGYLGDATSMDHLALEQSHLKDAEFGLHAAGIGLIAGIMRPFARVTHVSLTDSILDIPYMEDAPLAWLTGEAMKHSRIQHVCTSHKPPAIPWRRGKGRLKQIETTNSCAK